MRLASGLTACAVLMFLGLAGTLRAGEAPSRGAQRALPTHYVISDFDKDGGETGKLLGRIAPADAAYVRHKVFPNLKTLSDEEYLKTYAPLLGTMTRMSYLMAGDAVYWCLETDPGFVAIRFLPDGKMDFAALEPLPEDADDDPQYNLIYTPWDATMTPEDRTPGQWVRAPRPAIRIFEAALAHADKLLEEAGTAATPGDDDEDDE